MMKKGKIKFGSVVVIFLYLISLVFLLVDTLVGMFLLVLIGVVHLIVLAIKKTAKANRELKRKDCTKCGSEIGYKDISWDVIETVTKKNVSSNSTKAEEIGSVKLEKHCPECGNIDKHSFKIVLARYEKGAWSNYQAENQVKNKIGF